MFEPFSDPIDALGIIHAHAGTKADADGNRIFALAARRLEPDGNPTTFQTPVRYAGLTERDRRYSGVNPAALQDAPSAAEAARQLDRFLAGVRVVFHFDDGTGDLNLDALLPGRRFVDLAFAGAYLMPDLDAHTPKRLHEYLTETTRDTVRFTAAERVELNLALLQHLAETRLGEGSFPPAPVIRYYLTRSNTLFGTALVHVARHYRDYFGGPSSPCTTEDSGVWGRFLERADPVPKEPPPDETPCRGISDETLESRYRTLAETAKNYRFRPEQLAYGSHVASALADGAVLTVEAGTGTGKTQGYLIPALEFLRRNPRERVIISTYTKNLQAQIFGRELALSRETFRDLYRDIPVALLKGKSSYFCARKLDQLHEQGMRGRRLLAWLYLLHIAFRFQDADGDSPAETVRERLSPHLNEIRAEATAKIGCHTGHVRCPAQVVTADAATARLVITNHHKLALIDGDPLLAGRFRNVIIDEANHFEAAVRSAFTVEAGAPEIAPTLRYLESRIAGLAERKNTPHRKALSQALAGVRTLAAEIAALAEVLGNIPPKPPPGTVRELIYVHESYRSGHLNAHIDPMLDALESIKKGLEWAGDADAVSHLKLPGRSVQRIKTAINQLGDWAEALKVIRSGESVENRVASRQVFRRSFRLISQEVEVNHLIRRHIHDGKRSVIYTAATLCNHGSFEDFRRITGMEDDAPRRYRFARFPSPFARNRMEIIVPKTAVSGRYANKTAWTRTVIDALPRLIRETDGRTLVLFASYSDMIQIADAVAPHLDESRHPLLVQQRGRPTVSIRDEFRTVKESVLFGVETFWYGVDFRGDTLTQVIITRIPYPSPADPILAARKKILPTHQYWDRYRYDTDIKMKQGIGRLIRGETDRGRVVILDSRYRHED